MKKNMIKEKQKKRNKNTNAFGMVYKYYYCDIVIEYSNMIEHYIMMIANCMMDKWPKVEFVTIIYNKLTQCMGDIELTCVEYDGYK